MTDIVERLRELPRYWGVESLQAMRLEAAAEIERLRAALQQIADDATPGEPCHSLPQLLPGDKPQK